MGDEAAGPRRPHLLRVYPICSEASKSPKPFRFPGNSAAFPASESQRANRFVSFELRIWYASDGSKEWGHSWPLLCKGKKGHALPIFEAFTRVRKMPVLYRQRLADRVDIYRTRVCRDDRGGPIAPPTIVFCLRWTLSFWRVLAKRHLAPVARNACPFLFPKPKCAP